VLFPRSSHFIFFLILVFSTLSPDNPNTRVSLSHYFKIFPIQLHMRINPASGLKLIHLVFIACCLTLTSTSISLAQAPQVQWEQHFDGLLNGKDMSRSVAIDNSNNIYITGTSYQTYAGGNFSTIKYSPAGVMQWADHYYTVQSGGFNYGKKIMYDPTGALYAVGTLAINTGDLAILKYGPNGRLWAKNYQPYGLSTYADFGVDMGVDATGNLYAIAEVMSPAGNLEDLYIIKCDSSGTKLWEDNYSAASGPDYPVAMAVAPSGNAYPLLQAFNFFGTATNDITTIQYLPNSTQNWLSRYNGAGNADDYPAAITLDSQENQYICGTADAGATNDMVAMKQNIYGTRLWTCTYNGTANANDSAVSIHRLSNNLTVVTGRCKELVAGITRDAIVTLLIDSGTVVWTQKYFGVAGLGAVPNKMIVDQFDNIYICGYENSIGALKEACIIKYSASGSELWNLQYSGVQGLDDVYSDLVLDSNQDLIATGQTSTSINNANYLTVKYNNPTGIGEHIENSQLTLYPNPAAGVFIVKSSLQQKRWQLSVSDMNGRTLYHENDVTGLGEFHINCSAWNSGVYTVTLSSESTVSHSKILVNQ
jgi:hypothetical protein